MRRWMTGALFFLLIGTVAAQDAGTNASAFYDAIRANDLARLEAMLNSGSNPTVPDPRGGGTPLMYAAAFGSVDAMKLLLDHKADVNLPGSGGATALMWAVTDIQKVRLLLSRGADPKMATERGRTALTLAARSDGSAEIVKLLIAAGADPRSTDALKATALNAAAYGNDTETVRLLADAGGDINAPDFAGFTPLIQAAFNGNVEAVRLLIAKGADVNAKSGDGALQKVKAGTITLGYWTPLSAAATSGSTELIALLLNAGASINTPDVRGMTPLMLAVATDRQNPEVIRLLLDKGADVNARSAAGETALDWARKIGSPLVIDMLRSKGAVETRREPIAVPAPAHADLRTAVQRSLSLLTTASTVAAANGGCASCHAHNIVDLAEGAAASKGLAADQKLRMQRQVLTKAPFFSAANLLERMDPPAPDITAYALVALAASGYAPDRVTDAMVANHIALQRADGRWAMGAIARPPIEDGDIFRTALSIRALSVYGPPGRSAEIKERIARAGAWLRKATPATAEDRNMQLLGLHWAGLDAPVRNRLVKGILAKQRPDGGWSQTDHLTSDAYATGQTLFALAQAGTVKSDSAAFKKGIAYLLSTQRADGSWYVKSRSPKFQPFFDGGFPYGHDQWISSAATGWAAAALAQALPGIGDRRSSIVDRPSSIARKQ